MARQIKAGDSPPLQAAASAILSLLLPVRIADDGRFSEEIDSSYANGHTVAATLRKLSGRYPKILARSRLPPDALESVAKVVEAHTLDTMRGRGDHPLSSEIARHPVWISLIPLDIEDLEVEPPGALALRLTLLLIAEASQPLNGDPPRYWADIARMTWRWKSYSEDISTPLYVHIDRCVDAVLHGLPPHPDSLLPETVLEVVPETVLKNLQRAYRELARSVEGLQAPVAGPGPASPKQKPSKSPRDESVFCPPQTHWFLTVPRRIPRKQLELPEIPLSDLCEPLAGSNGSAETEADPDEILADEAVRPTIVASGVQSLPPTEAQKRKAAELEHHLRLRDQLALGSDFAATKEEAEEGGRLLLKIAESDPLSDSGRCAIELLISLATHRGYVAFEATTHSSTPADTFGFSDDLKYWHSRIKLNFKDAFYTPTDQQSALLHPSVTHVRLALPAELPPLLEKLRDAGRGTPGNYLSQPVPKEIRKELIWQLRAKGLPFVTEHRLRGFLLARLYELSGEIQLSQLIAGDGCGYSTAPLHYYAIPQDVIESFYATALKGIFPSFNIAEPKPLAPAAGRLYVGAPLAAQKAQPIFNTIKEFQTRNRSALADLHQVSKRHKPRPEATLEAARRGANSLSAQSAWMNIAAVAHRNTFWLGEMTLGHFLLQQRMAVVTDKVTDVAHLARVAAIPELLANQLQELIRGYAFLIESIESAGSAELSRHWVQTKQMLEAAIRGDGPIFLSINDRGKATPVTRDWLSSRLNWTLPDNALRHRLRFRLRQLDASPFEIDTQMGHQWGQQPFSSASTIAPLQHAAELSEKLDRYLQEDGWEVLKGPRPAMPVLALEAMPGRKQAALEVPGIPNAVPMEAHKQLISAFRQEFRQQHKNALQAGGDKNESKRLRLERLQRIDKAVTDCLAQTVSGYSIEAPPEGIQLSNEQVQDTYDEILTQQSTVFEADLASKRFRDRLATHRRKHGWNMRAPGPFVRPEPDHAPIDVHCFDAYRRLLHYRHWALSAFPTRAAEPPKGARTVGMPDLLLLKFVLLLIVDAGVVQRDLILQTVGRLREAKLCRKHGLLIVPVQRGNPDNLRAESVVLTGAAAALAFRILESKSASAAFDADKSWTQWSEGLVDLLGDGGARRPADDTDALECLCKLAALGHRIEYPGVTWSALDGSENHASLPLHRMAALIDGVAYPSLDKEAVEGLKPPPAVDLDASVQRVDVRRLTRKIWFYSNDQCPVPSQQRATSLRQELNVLLGRKPGTVGMGNATGPLSGIAANLADWALKRLDAVDPVTVHTDITRIGIDLARNLHGDSIDNLDSDELTTIFETIIGDPKKDRDKTLSALYRFHRWLRLQGRAAPLDVSDTYQHGPNADIEPAIVLEREFQHLESILGSWLDDARAKKDQAKPSPISTHLLEVARHIARLMFRAGLRTTEARRIRHGDLFSLGGRVFLLVRSSQIGRLKTPGSRRLLDLTSLLGTEAAELFEWVSAQRIKAGSSSQSNWPIFSAASKPNIPIRGALVVPVIGVALKAATGDTAAHAYWLRHGFAARTCLKPVLGQGLCSRLIADEHNFASDVTAHTASRLLGHIRRRTIWDSYLHIAALPAAHGAAIRFLSLSAESRALISGLQSSDQRVRAHRFKQKYPKAASGIYWPPEAHALASACDPRRLQHLPSTFPIAAPAIRESSSATSLGQVVEFIIGLNRGLDVTIASRRAGMQEHLAELAFNRLCLYQIRHRMKPITPSTTDEGDQMGQPGEAQQLQAASLKLAGQHAEAMLRNRRTPMTFESLINLREGGDRIYFRVRDLEETRQVEASLHRLRVAHVTQNGSVTCPGHGRNLSVLCLAIAVLRDLQAAPTSGSASLG